LPHEAVQEHERGRAREEGDDETGEQEPVAEDTTEPSDEERVEREERGCRGRPVVAGLGDPQVPLAVPTRPDVDGRPELVEPRTVPAAAGRIELVLEDEDRPGGERPEREPAPQEDPQGRQRRCDGAAHGATILDGRPSRGAGIRAESIHDVTTIAP
jgi:hypothetical protein